MANPNDTLPEGTDSIVTGAGVGSQDGSGSRNDSSISGNRSGSESGSTPGAGSETLGGGAASAGPAGGASSSGSSTSGTSGGTATGGSSTGTPRERAVETLRSGSEKLSGQAAEKARGLVSQGLERGGEALANVSKLIGDTATGLDERLGSQYGDYARKAATTIEETANRLAAKDADELIEDTRGFVRKSPGVALAGAAVLGFALVRLVKSGLDQNSESGGNARGGTGNAGNGKRRDTGSNNN